MILTREAEAGLYQIAQVVVEKTTPQFDKEFDYLVPEGIQVQPGCRVTVPFGRSNRRRLGLVLSLKEASTPGKCKPIFSVVDPEPLLGEEQLALLRYLKEYTFCSYFDGLSVLIPAGIGILMGEGYQLTGQQPDLEELTLPERQIVEYLAEKKKPVLSGTITQALGLVENHPALEALENRGFLEKVPLDRRKIQDERVAMVRIADRYLEQPPEKLTAKQGEVFRLLGEIGTASVKEICYFCGFTRAVIDRMEKAGLVEIYQQTVYRNPYQGVGPANNGEVALNQEQQQALEKLLGYLEAPQPQTVLLYGVTGSGKTQVFLKLIQHVVAQGRQVIVMVPEISLTPQTIDTFQRIFGQRTAVLHSSLTMGQRLDEWRRIRQGQVDIVVGTRSAVFAPCQNLGLIVMDEEQERTYKSEASPRFHARDVARARCHYHKAMLLLCSATPSIESYYQAQSGRYRMLTLTQRFSGGKLPDVYLIDMNEEGAGSAAACLSGTLTEELYHNLQAGQQSILLLNRRGYHTIAKCSSCGQVISCPNCSVALTYHSANNRLICHYCGYSQPLPGACPSCGSQMVRYSGIGTQRVEEQLCSLFPDGRILRMDMDTTMSRFSHEKKFQAFAQGEYDIMVGTQMVAKGLNFPKVTLVGVLNADLSLYSDDFRSFERTFSLITQVVGRSGRADLPGRAFIQTTDPQNAVIQLAAAQNYDDFYREEILFRKAGLYPPFCDMVAVGFTGSQEDEVKQGAKGFCDIFLSLAKTQYSDLPLRLLGPSPAGLYKVAGKYRYKLVLKCRNSKRLRQLLSTVLDQYYERREYRNVTAFVDMYYDATL